MKKKNSFEKKLPDISQIVRSLIKQQRTTQQAVAKKAGWKPPTFTELLKRTNWEIAELLLIGSILNHDLLQYYYPAPPEGMVPAGMVAELQSELSALQKAHQELETAYRDLKVENKVLREMMQK